MWGQTSVQYSGLEDVCGPQGMIDKGLKLWLESSALSIFSNLPEYWR